MKASEKVKVKCKKKMDSSHSKPSIRKDFEMQPDGFFQLHPYLLVYHGYIFFSIIVQFSVYKN